MHFFLCTISKVLFLNSNAFIIQSFYSFLQMDVPHDLLPNPAHNRATTRSGPISHFKLMPVLQHMQPGIASTAQLVSLSKSQIPSCTIASKYFEKSLKYVFGIFRILSILSILSIFSSISMTLRFFISSVDYIVNFEVLSIL